MDSNLPLPTSLRRVAARFLAPYLPALSLLMFAPVALAAPPETGVWVDHNGQGAVEIAPCGSRLCGHIFWLKETKNAKGQPLIDIYNPDTSKRKRAICGLPVLGNLQKQADGAWDTGWIYDPKDGKSYDLEIRAASRDRLTVTGYMGTKFFSKTMTWTRAPMSLGRCGATPKTEASVKGAPPAKPRKEAAKQPTAAPSSAVSPKTQASKQAVIPPSRPRAKPEQSAAGGSGNEAARVAKPSPKDDAVREVREPRFASDEPVLVSGPMPARRSVPAEKARQPASSEEGDPGERQTTPPPSRMNFYPAP